MKGLTVAVKSVVFVLGFSHASLAGVGSHGFLIGDDGVILDDVALSEILLKIVQTDFDVELTTTGNDVFSALIKLTKDEGVRLGQFLKTVDQLGEVSGIFGFNSYSDDRGDGVFHGSDGVRFGVIGAGNSSGLDQILIDS